jgi:hypothetical protein
VIASRIGYRIPVRESLLASGSATTKIAKNFIAFHLHNFVGDYTKAVRMRQFDGGHLTAGGAARE